jgi:hypothetical protein
VNLGPGPVQNGRCAAAAEAGVGRIVIAVYRPKPGMEWRLLAVVGRHMPVLRAGGLISDRPAQVMRAAGFEALAL